MTSLTQKSPVIVDIHSVDELAGKLKSGELAAGTMIGTEMGLARQSGLDRMAIRRILKPLIEQGLLQRQPGKGLFVGSKVRQRTVAVVVPGLELDQWVKVCRGIRDSKSAEQVRIQIYDAHHSLDREIEELKRLPETDVQGAIITMLPHPRFAESIFELKRLKMPFVLVDGEIPHLETNVVMTDHYEGGYQAGREMLSRGHRRIAWIGLHKHPGSRLRLEGLRDAIADAQLPYDRQLFRSLEVDDPMGDWTVEIETQTGFVMDLPHPPTVLFYTCDATAMIACKYLRKRGIRIPDDVSIMGFDGDPICQLVTPTIATMGQPNLQVGALALEVLLDAVEHPEKKPVVHKLGNTFIDGESLGKPAGK